MIRQTMILAALLALACPASDQELDRKQPSNPDRMTELQKGAAMQAIADEPGIKDVSWDPMGMPVLAVGMLPTSGRRDGLAQYMCEVIAEHGPARGVTVKIIDVTRKDFTVIGKARCP